MTCPDCPDVPNGTRKRAVCCKREGTARRTVGVPRPGERKCTACNGNGQLNRRIPAGQFMAGHFQPCDRCAATGVLPLRLKVGDRVPHSPRLDVRPAFTGAGTTSFRPARHGNRAPGK